MNKPLRQQVDSDLHTYECQLQYVPSFFVTFAGTSPVSEATAAATGLFEMSAVVELSVVEWACWTCVWFFCTGLSTSFKKLNFTEKLHVCLLFT